MSIGWPRLRAWVPKGLSGDDHHLPHMHKVGWALGILCSTSLRSEWTESQEGHSPPYPRAYSQVQKELAKSQTSSFSFWKLPPCSGCPGLPYPLGRVSRYKPDQFLDLSSSCLSFPSTGEYTLEPPYPTYKPLTLKSQ